MFLLGLLAVSAGAGLAGAAPAAAAGFTCDSSALRGSVLGQGPIEPVTANRGAAACADAQGGGANVLPAPLSASAVFATTGLLGPADDVKRQRASAAGGIADITIGAGVDLGLGPVVDQILAAVPPAALPLVDMQRLRQQIQSLVSPNAELLRIQAASAYAEAYCGGGQLQLVGRSNIAGITLLGLNLPTDAVVNETVKVVDDGTIRLSDLDVDAIVPLGSLPPVKQTVESLLAAVPPIPIDSPLAQIRITPGGQERTATSLTQRALQVRLTVAGQPVLDLTLGEARVGANDVDCTGTPPTNVAEAALQCTNRRLVLIDVLPEGRRVRLHGAADRRYVGQTVDIWFRHTRRIVARAKVRSDGTFTTTARMPRRGVRSTNRARYQARIGRERSMMLKLARRMRVRDLDVRSGKVRIRGRISRPLAKPIRSIEVRRRVSCGRWEVVKRIRPNRRGVFRTSVDAPAPGLAGTYRFATKVRHNTGNPKTFPTFTLPRYVG